MRYSFTSFSLPEATLPELLDTAVTFGYEGIEPRIQGGHGHGVEPDAPAGRRREIGALAADRGIDIVCIGSGCRLADPAGVQQQLVDGHAAIALAADVGSPLVRVFGGSVSDGVSEQQAIDQLVASLSELGDHAADRDVTVCLETHDAWTRPVLVADVLRAVDHPRVGVVWDVMHPPRTGGATIEDSYRELRQWIRHVHVHDSLLDPDSLAWTPIGEGKLDHRAVLRHLHTDGYRGFVSGEWINWEPADMHLPRELATLRGYQRELAG